WNEALGDFHFGSIKLPGIHRSGAAKRGYCLAVHKFEKNRFVLPNKSGPGSQAIRSGLSKRPNPNDLVAIVIRFADLRSHFIRTKSSINISLPVILGHN